MSVSKKVLDQYEMVIGLEVHVELKTKTKIFCGCPTDFGAPPNTQCCPVCSGMPGSLPVLNEQVLNYAIKAGLATNCTIASLSKQDRKNYFYPDLPKAYQISQLDLPLCEHGWLDIATDNAAGDGTGTAGERTGAAGEKRIGITRIHIEEDAGKLIHREGGGTLIDMNRCCVPLIEIVSEPDMRSAAEARAYLQKLRAIILYTGVSDVRMNEGSLRADVNLSVRKKGETALGTRTEMKNLNSFQFIVKAIEYEFARQVEAVENGEAIVQETRRYDQNSGKTFSMRRKEDANDYRYFPDPDLPPIRVTPERLAALKAEIPVLPDERKKGYVEKYGITPYAAEQLTLQRAVADYFEDTAERTEHPKLAANIVLSDIMPRLEAEDEIIPIPAAHTAAIAQMTGAGRINSRTVRELVRLLWEEAGARDPETLVRENGWEQVSDRATLEALAREVMAEQPQSVDSYRAGKTAALQALVGQVMKKTAGRGNPTAIQEIMTELLGGS